MPTFVDTHCHLNHPDFEADLREVLRRAEGVGVTRVVCAAYDLQTSDLAVRLAEEHPAISAAVGIHPHDADTFTPEIERHIRDLSAGRPKVVAIGEAGLDYYRSLSPRDAQRDAFRRHILMAHELGLPLIIHSRDAHEDVVKILEEVGMPERGAVMHCFPGDPEFARRSLDLGCFLGIAGPVTFKNGQAIQEVAGWMPLDRMLLETDAPYLAPHPYRGKRNEPGFVPVIAAKIAELRGISSDELAAATTANAERLFGLMPSAHS